MALEKLKEDFLDVVTKWRAADSQRMIFGVDMPQTQNAITELSESLQKAHALYPSFSIVEKEGKMAIVVKSADTSTVNSIPVNLPALPKLFKDIKVNSITINKGVTEEELKSFFGGISQPPHEIEEKGGLKGILEKHGVKYLKVDQMKFQLLNEDEETITSKDNVGGLIPGKGSGKPIDKKILAQLKKKHDSVWKDYLDGKLQANTFVEDYSDYLKEAADDPKKLTALLKRMAKNQKEMEKFVALLDEKLSDLGLSQETVKSLKKKIRTPKKVMVPEDELARLRKIEKEHAKNIDKHIDSSSEAIQRIRKKLQEEIARSEAILHQISQGGVILDKKGKIVSVNAIAEKILGMTDKEIRGKKIQNILKPHHLLTTVSDWQKETDDHTPKEVSVHSPSEETLALVRESTILIENEDGRSVGVISALHNIIQQEDLSRRKNDILDVLGHDLRAPLGAIRQNFDVLVASTKLTESCDEKQKKFLENCRNNIVRMGKLIEKIMDMRQLETGKIMLKYDVIETNKLIEEAVNSLTEWAQNKRIELKVKADKLPNIDGDPERLYQVITNLVSNALKFTPEEGSIVAEGKLVNNKGKKFIAISVTDSGMGIKKDNLQKIFDKYAQVTVNTPKGVSGLGLGLSICQTVIELHGGTIRADSEIGKGSTFTFEVPVQRTPIE